jgi:hypothetical protein
MRKCKLCEEHYDLSQTKSPNKNFCSRACLSKFRRITGVDLVEKTCIVCHEIFKADKYKHKDRQTCSRSCGNHLAWHDGKGELSKIKMKPKTCIFCNNQFFSKDKIVKYCSGDCISKARIERNKHKPKIIKKLNNCKVCQKHHTNKVYCSVACRRSNQKNHPWVKMNKQIKKDKKAYLDYVFQSFANMKVKK